MRRALVARIDTAKAYTYFLATQGWPKQQVDQQVLAPPLDERAILGTPPDQTSIMCYQLPGSITRDGRPIPGGNDINNGLCLCRSDLSSARGRPGHRGSGESDVTVDVYK